ncbi:MAG: cytochrome c oxidase subunit II [Deltaproteobacteria bacterium]|nr:cytochrome c oxidase subunit II [Deltaproteobacteria bacterium]
MIEKWVPAISSYAANVDFIFDLIFYIVIVFWFVLVQAVFLWLVVRYRKRDGVRAQYISGELAHEKKWISYPHYLVLLCDVVILVAAIRVWYIVKQDMPPTDETVRIVAQQWAWSFVHAGADGRLDTPDDIRTVDDLHLQVGKTYEFKLESRDVIHSFSVPVFRLKQDAIPGRVVTGWFKPIATGEHDIQCAEICGFGHGLMPGRIVIETPEAHVAWIASHGPSGAGE